MASNDEAIEAIYAASLDPAGWQDAVRAVGAALDTATGTIYLDRQSRDGIDTSLIATFGHGAEAVEAYHRHFSAINPFDRDADRFAVGEAVTAGVFDRKMRLAGAFEQTEYYNDWVRPQHLRHGIGSYLDRSNAGLVVASFYRPGDAGAYSQAETATFERMMRHVMRSIAVGVRLQTAESQMGAILGRRTAAVFTLDRSGRIRHANAVAQALLAAACGLAASMGTLRAALPQDQPALDRLIACVFDARRRNWAENARVSLRRTDGGPPLVARIAASGYRFGPFAPDRTASAVLTVEGFEAEKTLLCERLRQRFGLTPAQARLAETLFAGKSLREAAQDLGIGRETARSHLKAIFARTDTHRQAELVLLLRDLDG